MSIDYSLLPLAKGQPRVIAKADKTKADAKALKDAYKAVDASDRRTCDDVSNIVTVAADVHQLLEAHALEIEGTDANQRLIFRFNRRIVPRGQEPFALLSKRRSQREMR